MTADKAPRATPMPQRQPRLPTDANEFSVEVATVIADSKELVLELAPGERVEHYEIIRQIGHGGMGKVFMARDTRLGRVVAIKFLTNTNPELTRRFLVEAQTTARCTHENIVVIHSAATFRQHPYMVLEYLEGVSLASIIKDHPLSPARTVEIVVPVVRALTRAHQFGIVHRDLKPENIFITETGTVKVLDFGVAKLFGDPDEAITIDDERMSTSALYETLSTGGRVVGTLPFMAPEQFGVDTVDERADLWAIGVVLFRMLSGQHPLPDPNIAALMFSARDTATPIRSLGTVTPGLPARLIKTVDRCLRKLKAERYQTATQLLADLEELLPTRSGRRLGDEESPYPGLLSFEEDDADRFFGRGREVTRAVALLRDNPLLAIVGPSGAGKSSFVRAGLIPELKTSGAPWQTFIVRPGRDPIASLTPIIESVLGYTVDWGQCAARLRAEPGYVGALLREHARAKGTRFLVLVDQFEELYTLVADEVDRQIVTSILLGIADDPTSPLRLVLNLRSDFLHRVVEHEGFASVVMRSLLLLGPPDAQAMRDAVVGPAEKVGYAFESDAMVDEILAELTTSVAPYPLLQFCLATLWAQRDRSARSFRHETFRSIGGVAGALASHADTVIATLAHSGRHAARAIFQRLVTSENTRALVDREELVGAGTGDEVARVLATLVDARLVVMHEDTGTVEIVHEALITQWPQLRRWLDESREDTAYREQITAAARQWETKRRPAGLLWRGPAAVSEASRFLERHGETSLALREREFLAAVISLERKSGRTKRVVVGMVIVVLALAAAASIVGFLSIREAEQEARQAAETATKEATRAQAAERTVTDQLAVIQKSEAERKAAAEAAEKAAAEAEANAVEAAKRRADAEMSKEQLVAAFAKLKGALARSEIAQRTAETARTRAEAAAKSEQEARRQLQDALAREKERVRKLEEQRGKIVDKL